MGFPGGSDSKESAHSAGDSRLIPGLGRSLGEGNGNPLQHSCLDNPMGGEACSATVYVVTTEQLIVSLSFSLTNTLRFFTRVPLDTFLCSLPSFVTN